MSNLIKLPPFDENGDVNVVIETPRGSVVKYNYKPELHAFRLCRALGAGVSYPYDFGFVPGTLAEDGDPLDAMVLADFGAYPGVVVSCKILGVVKLSQKEKGGERTRNDRLLLVPICSPHVDRLDGPDDIPKRTRKELEEFFIEVDELTGKDPRVEGTEGRAEGRACLEAAILRAQGAKKQDA